MSKAFVNDDQGPSEVVRPLPVGRRPVTAQGDAAHRLALRRLLEDELAPLRAAVAAGHVEARPRVETLQRRARELERQIELSDVAPLPPSAPVRVVLGTQVWVRDEEEGAVLTFTLVGPDEVDAARRQVSHASPIGQALLGRKVGERTFIKRPAGILEVVIERLERATL